jgi:hypothetical protein
MDLAQAFIFYVGLIFFIAWGTLVVAVSVIAFGRDILPIAHRSAARKERP